MYYICCIYVYFANIATLSCHRSKRNAVEAEASAEAAGRVGQQPGGAGRWAVLGGAIPGRICMSLRAIKSANEPVVVGLAGMVQEQPATQ